MLLGALRSWPLSVVIVLLMAAAVQGQAAHPAASSHAAAPAGARAEPMPAQRAEIDDKEARDLFRLGKQAFDEGRFERALKYFQDAYDLSHRAVLLSNIGTVLDRLRRDEEALDTYKNYLAQVPDAPNRVQIEERVRIIEGALRKLPTDQSSGVASADVANNVPTPEQTAEAELAREQAARDGAAPMSDAQPSAGSSIVSRWWFWAGIGGVAVAAVVVGVAASSGGGVASESPALLGSATRVRPL